MAVRVQVKTMASRACSTHDAHLDLNQGRATHVFSLLGNTKLASHTLHSAYKTSLCVEPYMSLEYTIAANNALFEEDGVF